MKRSKMLQWVGAAALLCGLVLAAAFVSSAQTSSTSATVLSPRRTGIGLQPTASGTMGTTAQMLYWPGVCSSIEFQNRTGQIAYITFDGRTPSASSCDAVVANGADFRDFPRISGFSVVFVTGGTYTLGANPGVVCVGWLENPALVPIMPTPVEVAGLQTSFALKAGTYEVGFNTTTPSNQPYAPTYFKWNDRFTMRNTLNSGSANYAFGAPQFFSITAPSAFSEGGNDSGWGHGELIPAIDSPRIYIDGKKMTSALTGRLYEAMTTHCELQTTTYLDDGDTRVAQIDQTWWVTPVYIRYRTTVKLTQPVTFDSHYALELGFCADSSLGTTRTAQYANFVAYLTSGLTLSGPHTVGVTNTAYLNEPYICGFYSSTHGLVTILDFRNTATAQLTGNGDARDTNCYIFNNATNTSKFYWEGNWLTEADNTQTANTEATWEAFITTKGATSGTYQALTSGSPTPTTLLGIYNTARTE